jgi:hypothetical protein
MLVRVLGIHEHVKGVGLDVQLKPAPPDGRLPPLLGSGVLLQVLREVVGESGVVVVPAGLRRAREQPDEAARVPPAVGDGEELPVRRRHPTAEARLHGGDPLLGGGWELRHAPDAATHH